LEEPDYELNIIEILVFQTNFVVLWIHK